MQTAFSTLPAANVTLSLISLTENIHNYPLASLPRPQRIDDINSRQAGAIGSLNLVMVLLFPASHSCEQKAIIQEKA